MASVLIVDDEPNIRRMVGALLASEGYEVREAQDGARGVALAVESEPDLALVAHEVDGTETLRVAPFSQLAAGDRARLPGGLEDAYPLTLALREWADARAGGRLVSVLEGGWEALPLGAAVVQHLHALIGLGPA